MAIQFQGNSGIVAEVDGAAGSAFRALRINSRPLDYGTLGHYRLATTVALVATQAANGTLFSFRWGDATRLCVISKLQVEVLQTAAATATIMPSFEVVLARSFSASDTIGTAITLTTNSMKRRTSMGTTLVTDIRKSAVAAGLTAGTRTLDADPVLQLLTQQAITTPNATIYRDGMDIDVADGNHPFVFAQNEGFIIRGPTVVFGAAGTANLAVEVGWAEVTSY